MLAVVSRGDGLAADLQEGELQIVGVARSASLRTVAGSVFRGRPSQPRTCRGVSTQAPGATAADGGDGEPTRTRTWDQGIMSPSAYRLDDVLTRCHDVSSVASHGGAPALRAGRKEAVRQVG